VSERRAEDVIRELGRLADDLGPALVPTEHHELLRSITTAAMQLFGAAACSLALLDDAEEHLVFHVASGAGAADVVGLRVPVGQGVAGWVVTSGQPISIADVTRDPRFARDVAEQTGYVPRSILAMPLETERAMLGVIEVLDRRSEGGEGAEDMTLLAVFANQAALAIEGGRVFSNLGRTLFRAAAQASDARGLSAALEAAAESTPGPSADLAELAACMAELGRLGPEERRAATRSVTHFLDYVRAREKMK
jgi:GAF domain-containing protein